MSNQKLKACEIYPIYGIHVYTYDVVQCVVCCFLHVCIMLLRCLVFFKNIVPPFSIIMFLHYFHIKNSFLASIIMSCDGYLIGEYLYQRYSPILHHTHYMYIMCIVYSMITQDVNIVTCELCGSILCIVFN